MATVVSLRYPWPRQDKASLSFVPNLVSAGSCPRRSDTRARTCWVREVQWQGRGWTGSGWDLAWAGSREGGCVPGPMGGSNDVTDVDVAAAATLPLQLPRNGVLCIVHCIIALTLTSSSGQPRKRVPSFGSRYYVEVHAGVLHFSRNGWIGCTDGDRQTFFSLLCKPRPNTHTRML